MTAALPLHKLTQAYERHGRRLPPVANLLLLALIAATLARLAWTLLPVPEAGRWQPAPAAAARPAAQAGPGPADVERLAGANLFGSYEAVPGASDLDNAPDTRLNLTLIGILAGRGNDDSRALIADGSGEEKPYAIGDDLARGVTLEAIFADRVVLMRNGKAETLRLNKDQPGSSGVAASGPVDTGTAVDAGTAATLGAARDQILQDPSRASEYIRVQPASVNGQLRGYRVYPGRERELFNNVGLRPGDVVTAVNGIELDNAQKALQMLSDLSKSSNFALTVERGGQAQTVNVTLN
ncbi:type II secretion system protein GspC [Solimonas sp. K1W22B-7]|uniref:type II secretion system protein GspC n=1 Tax=Solimonas sp. K1W22B-7 TaxID=2303331 RepID=UPI000E3333DA|nr:type II secretion system protein GspC [Solimonas sp. K1W22B-7]AXQ29139.1 type II secretion system protein GspC [Solimonas sp. K1W22B-7]